MRAHCHALLLALTAVVATGAASAEMRQIVPRATDAVLFNPGMGLYLQYPPMDSQPDEWFMPLADIAYYRMDWAQVNPEPGVYRFEEVLGPVFDFWVTQRGKRVAFRFMCQNMHSDKQYVTPRWVFDAGVPAVTHKGLYVPEQTDPAFWSPQYLAIQCEFIRKLGEYLDGRPGLEFVDIGSIGEWGEMHLARWTRDQFDATGYSETAYVAAYRRVIDEHRRAFPRTRVFLNVGGRDHLNINDYAAINGMHFRQDGLRPAGASYDVGSWLYTDYAPRGVQCNYEFCYGLDEMRSLGLDVAATFNKGLEAPISYLNTNLGNYRTLPDDVRLMMRDAARRIGYRLIITGLDCPTDFSVTGTLPPRLPLRSVWRNDGVAPCYQSLAVEWTLCDVAGDAVHSELQYPPAPTTRWAPGQEQELRTLLRPPTNLPPGQYTLKAALLDPATGQRMLLALEGKDAANRYALCDLPAIQRDATQTTLFEDGFETGPLAWQSGEGMTATIDDTDAHSEIHSLLVEGTQAAGWNYLNLRLPVAPPAAGRVRLTAWVKVDSIEPDSYPPFLKISANRADGSWIENYNTGGYDMARPGTWQLLDVSPDVAPDTGTADICVEKGLFDASVKIRFRLDDVKLEVTELP